MPDTWRADLLSKATAAEWPCVIPGTILGALYPSFPRSRPGDLRLRLTEFADPGGQAVYFRLQDFEGSVADELLSGGE